MSTALRKRGPERARKLGATKLADDAPRAPLGELSNTALPVAKAGPAWQPPPPAPLALFVGDTDGFSELLPRQPMRTEAGPSLANKLPGAGVYHLAHGVLSSLHQRTVALLADEEVPSGGDFGGGDLAGVVGNSLGAVGRYAAVLGTAIDTLVEGGLDSLQQLRLVERSLGNQAAPPELASEPAAALPACTPPPAPRPSGWDAWSDTPFSAPRPAAASRSPGAEELAEQVREQLQLLLVEKAKLAAENARLQRENASLQELLSYQQEGSDEEGEQTAPPLPTHAEGFATPPASPLP